MKKKIKKISILLVLCMLCTVMFGSLAAHADSSEVYAGDSIRWVSMRAYKQSYNNIRVDIQVNYTNYPDYFEGLDQLTLDTNGLESCLISATTYFADGKSISSPDVGSLSYSWIFNITNVNYIYAPVYSFVATIEFSSIDPNAVQTVTFRIATLSRTLTFVPSAL